jgi:hypothetical protein
MELMLWQRRLENDEATQRLSSAARRRESSTIVNPNLCESSRLVAARHSRVHCNEGLASIPAFKAVMIARTASQLVSRIYHTPGIKR